MLTQATKPPQLLTGSLDQPSYSYLNLAKANSIKSSQYFYLQVPSGVTHISKSTNKSSFRRKTLHSDRSCSHSNGKFRGNSRSQSKNRKLTNRLSEKPGSNMKKKQYKVIGSKVNETKVKTKKTQKPFLKKMTSLQSLFKKPQLLTQRKKNNHQKFSKRLKTQKSKDMRKTRQVKKSESQSALDNLALSEIQKVRKSGMRDQRVIHEYFGHDDQLASILELKEDKFRRSKTKIDKLKTRSSASSNSQRKLSKFGKSPKAK